MNFYEKNKENIDDDLRFGDIISGFISLTPEIKKKDLNVLNKEFIINVETPDYSVIMTPCCTIKHSKDDIISITPLIKVRSSFFDNPYFAEDLCRINRKMKPEQTLSPEGWDRLPLEEKQKRLNVGLSYALLELFIYDKNDLLKEYTVNRIKEENFKTNYYMINFKYSFKIGCNKNQLQKVKLLQLSSSTRIELNEKINCYFRIPKEDENV